MGALTSVIAALLLLGGAPGLRLLDDRVGVRAVSALSARGSDSMLADDEPSPASSAPRTARSSDSVPYGAMEDEPSGGASLGRDAGFEELDHGRVPPIDKFTDVWEQRYASEAHLAEALPSTIRLVLGLFTVAQDAAYREVVRRTWLNQTGVCYWSQEVQDNCSVYVAFVIGKGFNGAEGVDLTDEDVARAHAEPGVFALPCAENMNKGKSLVWFQEALKAFPWATHIGKTDMDTYPFLHKLLSRMEAGHSCEEHDQKRYEYIGRTHNPGYGKRFGSACPRTDCNRQYTSSQDHTKSVSRPGHSFRFLSGELYILSYPLAAEVAWERPSWMTEDAVVAEAVDEAAQAKGFCVAIRRLDSWYHNNAEVSPRFANRLD